MLFAAGIALPMPPKPQRRPPAPEFGRGFGTPRPPFQIVALILQMIRNCFS
jgi:uncharacterized protein YbbK (DUF523 family)